MVASCLLDGSPIMKPSHLALALVSATAACMPPLPPPPDLQVTSPERGLVQGEAQVVVTGRALPGPDGSPVYKVTVNDTVARVAADGSFEVSVPTPTGALLLETVAYSQDGGRAIDARAVHVGEVRPVGTRIPAAFGATLSADGFALISRAASDLLNTVDLSSLIPAISYGGSTANLALTVSQLTLADTTIALTPVAGGLQIAVRIDGLAARARAKYAGTLVPDGSTDITVRADQIAFTGTLVVTPTAAGFKTSVSAPDITSTGLSVDATGLAGTILDLLMDNLEGTIAGIAKSSIASALDPALAKALGGLDAPRTVDVLGHSLTVAASANQIELSAAGALASLDLSAHLGGLDALPSYVYTPNGQPEIDPGYGVQLAVADDLVNDMLAQVHALGVLDLSLDKDFGLFDRATMKLQLPPMLTAHTDDGTARLVLGDMILTATDGDRTLVRAAVNASIDVAVDRGEVANEIAIRMGEAHVVVNLLDDPQDPSQITAEELTGASNAGVGLQIKSLDKVLVSVPTPSFAGVSVDSFELHGDRGYLVLGGQLHAAAAGQ